MNRRARLIRFGYKPYQSHEKLISHKVGAKFRGPQGLPLGGKQTKGRVVPMVAFCPWLCGKPPVGYDSSVSRGQLPDCPLAPNGWNGNDNEPSFLLVCVPT